ncbi:methyltransferase domain-containing protein [Actinomadura mexicana]|uniref:Methyltransferase domain-containing protein n=1 Tax=Actinomadura mexicana TaxID=134959 RepID=A0A238XJ02_9ACTN|nr:methyltransferase domain-containing protein [Actinomadura mexicana]SNR58975.1 Methyltransferase domain-containing protein [Actinomadura mexicana]
MNLPPADAPGSAAENETGDEGRGHREERVHRPGPRIGDAVGDMLLAAYRASLDPAADPVLQIAERDDGLVVPLPVAPWIAAIDHWPGEERQALELVKGKVLDIGAGGGRAARALLDRGHEVTALDVSPGALEVCRRQGIRSAVLGTVDEHAAAGRRYDSFLLLGANLGLLGSREQAPGFLRALAAMAAPGAVIVGHGRNLTDSDDPMHLSYNRRNLRAGRIAGQRTLRIRYRDVATPWFPYLNLAPRELAELTTGTGWELTDITHFESSPSGYTATLHHQ